MAYRYPTNNRNPQPVRPVPAPRRLTIEEKEYAEKQEQLNELYAAIYEENERNDQEKDEHEELVGEKHGECLSLASFLCEDIRYERRLEDAGLGKYVPTSQNRVKITAYQKELAHLQNKLREGQQYLKDFPAFVEEMELREECWLVAHNQIWSLMKYEKIKAAWPEEPEDVNPDYRNVDGLDRMMQDFDFKNCKLEEEVEEQEQEVVEEEVVEEDLDSIEIIDYPILPEVIGFKPFIPEPGDKNADENDGANCG